MTTKLRDQEMQFQKANVDVTELRGKVATLSTELQVPVVLLSLLTIAKESVEKVVLLEKQNANLSAEILTLRGELTRAQELTEKTETRVFVCVNFH